MAKSSTPATRKRKAYQRSTKGCRNCKVRSVKCDEAKPQCFKCKAYRVICSYGKNISELETVTQGNSWTVPTALQANELEIARPVTSTLSISYECGTGVDSFSLDSHSLTSLQRFRLQTLSSLGGSIFVKVGEELIDRLAFTHPVLMHTLLAVSEAHWRYVAGPSNADKSYEETFHQGQSLQLFIKALSRPIQPEDRDPLWATAAFLSIVSFTCSAASTPESAWPLLASKDGSDLEWLRMSHGKMSIWNVTTPLRPGGIFCAMTDDYLEAQSALISQGTLGIPSEIVQLCELNSESTFNNNPYFGPACVLAELQGASTDLSAKIKWLRFIGKMSTAYKRLLVQKDPRALILLALWYQNARHALWWIERRATVEYEAIRIYLSLYHQEDTKVQTFIRSYLPPLSHEEAQNYSPFAEPGQICRMP